MSSKAGAARKGLEDRALEVRGLRRCARCVEVKALAHFYTGYGTCKRCEAVNRAERDDRRDPQ